MLLILICFTWKFHFLPSFSQNSSFIAPDLGAWWKRPVITPFLAYQCSEPTEINKPRRLPCGDQHFTFILCKAYWRQWLGVVQSLSSVWLFATLSTTACHTFLSLTISQSLLKLMSIESVMLSNHFISATFFFFCLQPFPESGSFPMSQLFASGGQSISASASTSALQMNIQGWSPLGLNSLILQSKELSKVFSTTTVLWLLAFFMVKLSHPYMTGKKP